jgi:uncharacterized protein (DUF433 family)
VTSVNAAVTDLLGRGLYTIPEASRLLGCPSGTVRRWVQGYGFPLSRWARSHKPWLFEPALPRIKGETTLTFLDLVQLRVVQGFRGAGVPLQRIRTAAVTAADIFETSHPLASERFKTDGRDIFAHALDRGADLGLVKLSAAAQKAFPQMVEESLREISYATETKLAERWYVAGRDGGIVIDPRIAFGAPVIERVNVPTRVVWEQAQSEPEPDALARWFDLDLAQVRSALKYEERLLARAA